MHELSVLHVAESSKQFAQNVCVYVGMYMLQWLHFCKNGYRRITQQKIVSNGTNAMCQA